MPRHIFIGPTNTLVEGICFTNGLFSTTDEEKVARLKRSARFGDTIKEMELDEEGNILGVMGKDTPVAVDDVPNPIETPPPVNVLTPDQLIVDAQPIPPKASAPVPDAPKPSAEPKKKIHNTPRNKKKQGK